MDKLEHGDGEASDVPLEDELGSDSESDSNLGVIDWSPLDQQCDSTIRDELQEDFESKYAKIGALS